MNDNENNHNDNECMQCKRLSSQSASSVKKTVLSISVLNKHYKDAQNIIR